MTMQEATFLTLKQLRRLYPEGEAGVIADWLLESITGSGKAERMVYKNSPITSREEEQLHQHLERLINHEPVQYVLQEAWFYKMKWFVDKRVLIPRPETEQLVEWILEEQTNTDLWILDIGTGSGCIAITLKTKRPTWEVWALDESDDALAVTKINAERHRAAVQLLQLDFLDAATHEKLPRFNCIVSNPPYIPITGAAEMAKHVVTHEPGKALFVPDEDPLVFYKAIAVFGQTHLLPDGAIYCEIHEDFGTPCCRLFENFGYTCTLVKDLQGKDRLIKALHR